jgi:hypothetical protein
MTTRDEALQMAIKAMTSGFGMVAAVEACRAALSDETVMLPDGLVSDERRMNYLSNGGWEVLQDPKYWTDELNLRQVIDRNIVAPTCEKEKG